MFIKLWEISNECISVILTHPVENQVSYILFLEKTWHTQAYADFPIYNYKVET